MGKKYFVWNFDDGLEQDKKIIEILKEFDMGATFNLNSGMYGDKTYEGRIGNLGITEMPAEKYEAQKRHLLPYVPHFRIPEDEVREVYKGFEIASHTLTHKNLKTCDEVELRREILYDVRRLTEKFEQEIVGFAYPYGAVSDACIPLLKKAGIQYARTVETAKDFHFPEDPLRMPLTGWIAQKNILQRLDEFCNAEDEEDLFFLMFAHGYEFDFGTRECNWETLTQICGTVKCHSDIICCSTGEAFRRHSAQ